MNNIQLSSLNHVVNDIVDILQSDLKMDINYHSKTIDHIYNYTYKTIYQYVNLFVDTQEKIYIINKFFRFIFFFSSVHTRKCKIIVR